jgi:dual specificity tyrosine-phosphorylation-regulated kinase 1
MWSLGCILVEMHTGEPLFSGSDQFDQMQKIVKLLGMVPDRMLEKASDHIKFQFSERNVGNGNWHLRQTKMAPLSSSSNATTATIAAAVSAVASPSSTQAAHMIVPSLDPIASLTKVIIPSVDCHYYHNDPSNSQRNYTLFIDLIYKMLVYDPSERIKPAEALKHPFLDDEASTTPTMSSTSSTPQKRKLDSLPCPTTMTRLWWRSSQSRNNNNNHHQN